MATRTVVDCDRCKKKETVLPSGRFKMEVGDSPDGNGGHDVDYEYADLCPDCIAIELKMFLAILNEPSRANWAQRVRKGGK